VFRQLPAAQRKHSGTLLLGNRSYAVAIPSLVATFGL
jgi:hypothetical protein